jgi:hypothetical protein
MRQHESCHSGGTGRVKHSTWQRLEEGHTSRPSQYGRFVGVVLRVLLTCFFPPISYTEYPMHIYCEEREEEWG